jgi:hypothetical protein
MASLNSILRKALRKFHVRIAANDMKVYIYICTIQYNTTEGADSHLWNQSKCGNWPPMFIWHTATHSNQTLMQSATLIYVDGIKGYIVSSLGINWKRLREFCQIAPTWNNFGEIWCHQIPPLTGKSSDTWISVIVKLADSLLAEWRQTAYLLHLYFSLMSTSQVCFLLFSLQTFVFSIHNVKHYSPYFSCHYGQMPLNKSKA